MSTVIEAIHLSKRYKTPFRRKKVEAVCDVSFAVQAGQVFGFLGPNGAGKTTTIRLLMGLISPSAGEVRIFGHRIPSQKARAAIGFVPEMPYFYEYLTVAELLDLAGRLYGVEAATRKRRGKELIDLVGLGAAVNRRLKSYSKGMLQRAGIAQALISNPDLLVLDEPMSGLDPVGRKEVRDIIHGLHRQGKTIFFSSHILADVELLCDHVAFIFAGRIHGSGRLSDMIRSNAGGTDVTLYLSAGVDGDVLDRLVVPGSSVKQGAEQITLVLPPQADVHAVLDRARALGIPVISVVPRHETLEELFLRRLQTGAGAAGAAHDNRDGAA